MTTGGRRGAGREGRRDRPAGRRSHRRSAPADRPSSEPCKRLSKDVPSHERKDATMRLDAKTVPVAAAGQGVGLYDLAGRATP